MSKYYTRFPKESAAEAIAHHPDGGYDTQEEAIAEMVEGAADIIDDYGPIFYVINEFGDNVQSYSLQQNEDGKYTAHVLHYFGKLLYVDNGELAIETNTMNNMSYQAWAITKDRTDDQYKELHNRLEDKANLRLMHAVMGISGESGELTDAIKKTIMYGKPLDVKNVKEELGDLLWYMSILLDTIGSSFSEVMKMNHDKLEARYPGGFTEAKANARMDKKEEE